MFLDTDSIKVKVDSGSYVSMGQYLIEAKYSYNKLWSSDSGRNLAGKQSGTLIGIFPKIVLTFKRLTKAELEIIVPLIDSAKQTVRYYDPNKKAYVEMATYTGDYEISNKRMISKSKNEGFSVSFISVARRS